MKNRPWNTLSGDALATAVFESLEYLADDGRARELLRRVAKTVEGASVSGTRLELSLGHGYRLTIVEAVPREEPVSPSWPAIYSAAAHRDLSFSLPGQEGLALGPDVIDLDDYDLPLPFEECPPRLAVALRDFSNWWVFVPQLDGSMALTLLDHGGNFGAPTELSPGGLFLARVVEIMGQGPEPREVPIPQRETGAVLTRRAVSEHFADTRKKHIQVVSEGPRCSYLVGRQHVVIVDSVDPSKTLAHLAVETGRDVNAAHRDGELVIGHRKGNVLIDVEDPNVPRLVKSSAHEGDKLDCSIRAGSEEYVHAPNGHKEGDNGAWYSVDGTGTFREFAEEDSTVTDAVVVGERMYVASQSSLSLFDLAPPELPTTRVRVALDGYSAKLVPVPELGLLLVVDAAPAHALRVVSLDSLRAPSSRWSVLNLKGRKQVPCWQLTGSTIHLLIFDEEEAFSVVTIGLDAAVPPIIQSTTRVTLPEGRRPWEPCMVRVSDERVGLLFRDGEWIEWALL